MGKDSIIEENRKHINLTSGIMHILQGEIKRQGELEYMNLFL